MPSHRLTQHKVGQKHCFSPCSNDMDDVINLSGTLARFGMTGFFDEVSSKVEYQRSYRCNANSTYQFSNLTIQGMHVFISVKNFQVQVFEFKHNGTFGNGEFFYMYMYTERDDNCCAP